MAPETKDDKAARQVREGKLRAQADRGADAARVYGSPVVKEFFDKIKERLRQEWERSPPGASAEREHQWRLHQAVTLLEDCFKATIANGGAAHKELTKLVKPKEK